MLFTDEVHMDRMRWNTEAALLILQLTSDSASPDRGQQVCKHCLQNSQLIRLPKHVRRTLLILNCRTFRS